MSKHYTLNEYKEKFKRCIMEYTNAAGSFDIDEEGEDQNEMPMGGEDPNMGGGDPMMGGDQNMGGGDPMMGGDQNMGGEDPMMGGDQNMGGEDPNMGNGEQSPEGFNPEGDPNTGLEGMGSNPNMGGDEVPMDNGMEPDDEVIDVDDLTKSQEKAEKKIDKMNDKFEKLMGAINTLIKMNAERDKKEIESQEKLKAEIDKRMPTPQQRLTMRSTKSAPYSMTPNEYMNNYAPENYSDADDNNGADDAQYQITKDDIDRFTDYNSIAKDLDIEHQGLRDILGF